MKYEQIVEQIKTNPLSMALSSLNKRGISIDSFRNNNRSNLPIARGPISSSSKSMTSQGVVINTMGILSNLTSRTQSQLHNAKNTGAMLLPSKDSRYLNKKTLVLDLDETLVHSDLVQFSLHTDFTMEVKMDNQDNEVYVCVRPYTNVFLEKMAKHYELVIYTASIGKYAEPLIERLDPKRLISHRLYREHCAMTINNNLIKDLKKLNRNLKDVILIDNSPSCFGPTPENGIPIKTWTDDQKDRELMKLIPVLEQLKDVNDVREFIPQFIEKTEIPKSNCVKNIEGVDIKRKMMSQSFTEQCRLDLNDNEASNNKTVKKLFKDEIENSNDYSNNTTNQKSVDTLIESTKTVCNTGSQYHKSNTRSEYDQKIMRNAYVSNKNNQDRIKDNNKEEDYQIQSNLIRTNHTSNTLINRNKHQSLLLLSINLNNTKGSGGAIIIKNNQKVNDIISKQANDQRLYTQPDNTTHDHDHNHNQDFEIHREDNQLHKHHNTNNRRVLLEDPNDKRGYNNSSTKFSIIDSQANKISNLTSIFSVSGRIQTKGIICKNNLNNHYS